MAAYGGNTALLVGGVTLLGAIGYYMTRKDGKPSPDMKQQARDFKETAVSKGNTDAQQAKVNKTSFCASVFVSKTHTSREFKKKWSGPALRPDLR